MAKILLDLWMSPPDGRERYETREDCTTNRFGLKSLQGIPHGLSSVQLFLIGTALKC